MQTLYTVRNLIARQFNNTQLTILACLVVALILYIIYTLFQKRRSHGLDGDVVVRFQKGPCFGTCPVYDIKIDHKGNLQYNGKRHVRIKGKKYKKLGPDVVNEIYEGAKSINFWQMPEKYDTDMTDLPSTILTLTGQDNNGEKTVVARADIPHHLLVYLEHLENYWREFVE
jgi:hypothetical protein